MLRALLLVLLCSPWSTGCRHQPIALAAPDDLSAGVRVIGTGEATGAPDLAKVDVGVVVRDTTAGGATAEANRRVAALLAAVGSLGVAKADLRTQTVGLHEERTEVMRPIPRPEGDESGPTDRAALPVTHFVATNMVEITVRDLARLGSILGAATETGANQIHGVRFELAEPDTLRATARERAMGDARAKAEQLATLAGARLGPAVAVRSGGGGGMPMPMTFAKSLDESASVPTEPGQLTVTEQVEVRFELDRR